MYEIYFPLVDAYLGEPCGCDCCSTHGICAAVRAQAPSSRWSSRELSEAIDMARTCALIFRTGGESHVRRNTETVFTCLYEPNARWHRTAEGEADT